MFANRLFIGNIVISTANNIENYDAFEKFFFFKKKQMKGVREQIH